MRTRVLVLGGNLAGLTTATSVKRALDGDVDVRVVSASDRFLFKPSLIGLVFGRRRSEEITVPLAGPLGNHGVAFTHATATFIDPVARRVESTAGSYEYDYLVIATGHRSREDLVPGLTEVEGVHTITSLEGAGRAGDGWHRLRQNPGPVVVAAAPGARCLGAAYEFLFAMAYELRTAGLYPADLTYITAEPYAGHFGIGGLVSSAQLIRSLLTADGITTIPDTAIDEVLPGKLVVAGHTPVPFTYAVVIPPLEGQEVVAGATGLSDDRGLVPVHDTCQSVAYPDVYAVGAAAAVTVPWTTAVPVGVPKGGFPAEVQARVAASNIAAQVLGRAPAERAVFGDYPTCVLDAGPHGVLMLGDKTPPAGRAGVLIPGLQARGMRVLFEKYFLWKTQAGHLRPA